MRIEGDNVSIDVDSDVSEDVIFEAESAANEAVWKNIPVEILYPSMDEVKKFARKLPPEKSTLREGKLAATVSAISCSKGDKKLLNRNFWLFIAPCAKSTSFIAVSSPSVPL